MNVAALLIVKDEAETFPQCVASLAGIVSELIVVDTGSTDDTLHVVGETAERHGLPYRLAQRPWVDFATNRNELLDLAAWSAADWWLLPDADMVADHAAESFTGLSGADVGMVQVNHGGTVYRLPLLLRAGNPSRYVGAVHEYLEPLGVVADCDAITFRTIRGSRAHERDDVAALSPDPRQAFYLAQTLHEQGRTDDALAFYRFRATQGGFEEERWTAQYRAAAITGDVGDLLAAWSARPTRAEPLVDAARILNERGAHEAAYLLADRVVGKMSQPDDLLFVDPSAYTWGPCFQLAIASWWTGRRKRAAALNAKLLELDLPDHVRAAVEANAALD